MLSVSPRATCILLDLNTAFWDIQLIVPSVYDLAECESAKNVANIPAPEANSLDRFKGSAIFISGSVLQNTIITSNTKNPFEPFLSPHAQQGDLMKSTSLKQLQ
jgi:hypothetical protein